MPQQQSTNAIISGQFLIVARLTKSYVAYVTRPNPAAYMKNNESDAVECCFTTKKANPK